MIINIAYHITVFLYMRKCQNRNNVWSESTALNNNNKEKQNVLEMKEACGRLW